MKLTDEQRFRLYLAAMSGLLQKPTALPTTTPPNRQGDTKTVNPPFAVACWAHAIVRASEHVLEDDDADRDRGGDSTPPPFA